MDSEQLRTGSLSSLNVQVPLSSLGGSLIPIQFIGMGMVFIAQAGKIRFFLLLCPPCHAMIFVVSEGGRYNESLVSADHTRVM
jgi:hypothetical protein